jgi:hypothetical protein
VVWARSPALHFVALGALLFVVDRLEWLPGAEDARDPSLVITAERTSALRRDWLSRTGRWPSSAEVEASIEREIDDELLYREARRLGIQHSDSLVRRRLIRNMGFVSGGRDDPEQLLREALGLGMDRADLVVRRRLIQRLKLRVAAEARRGSVGDAELLDYLDRHAFEFGEPLRVRAAHVYLSRDRRGARLDADARALREDLSVRSVGPDRAAELGDFFLHGNELPSQSERELALKFGTGFASEVVRLPTGGWHGPVSSSYGKHFVWVRAREPWQPAQLEAVRGEVREALLTQRAERALAALLERLRRDRPIRVARSGEEIVARNR